VLILGLVSSAFAAQIDWTRPQLCGLSTVVVVAEVTSTETRWAPGPDGGIETIVWFATREAVKGVAPEPLVLTLPGGRLGEIGHWVEDQPALTVDATYLLLLADTSEGLKILGGERGAVPIATPGHEGEALDAAKRSLGDCRAP
jgi:hypothetical protein